jgi:hypothetical protein
VIKTERDAAPPGWFCRMWAAIKSVLNFCIAAFYTYLGGAALALLVLKMLESLPDDGNPLRTYPILLALCCLCFLIGFWFFRKWLHGRRAVR